ncbi:hypothetical protein NBRC10512_004934 [Rhodotorula toruloides]|uniref:RHTO0S01e13080g1_1 n=2 Tax=Rhodotorula toruloides TaxID=5286 RepID=A0A061AL56_RHOTO|nr:mitogen-activated protein kinase kinase kinase kinase 4-like protein [Rhodotorula toruloides NP11]EMS24498.1 mitogen-activated protein kinase kinase kinase kinase 4-like protein [Rhodotorula toruloides NP11]CDR36050.1 RHTO0S01e13080g1_1 [Rhodotorula toruloides]
MPDSSNRFSTQSAASTSSSVGGSSFRHSLSSSSNGRLTPASERLSIRVPDNKRYLRGATSVAGRTSEEVGEGDHGETWVDADEGEHAGGQHNAQDEVEEADRGVGWTGSASEAVGVGLGLGFDVDMGAVRADALRTPPRIEREVGGVDTGASTMLRDHVDGEFAPSAGADSISHTSEASTSSTALSTHQSVASSDSSTLSLPTAPPVDLSLPNRPNASGPFVSVASGPMGRLAAENASTSRPTTSSSARSFLSSLLNRSPRSSGHSPRFTTPNTSSSSSPNPSIPRSPSAPHGWQPHPTVAALQSNDAIHSRSTSMPAIAGAPQPRSSSDLFRPESVACNAPQRRTPRSIAAATFAGLARSTSLRGTADSSSMSSGSHRPAPPETQSPVPTIGLSTPPPPPLVPSPPTLASIGLTVNPLTQQLSLSRNAQPLCGALLDNKYLLIGTTAGLDFLPLPLPGSLPMKHHGLKKRRETRKPIPLIKRTRFKELAVLNERSNILLAIAGRNDHVRVYALDGIRAMIERKMAEIDIKDGYPIIQDAAIFDSATPTPRSTAAKGKQRAEPSDASSSSHDAPLATFPRPSQLAPNSSYQFPSTSPSDPQAPTPRRRPSLARNRPPSWHRLSNPLYSAVSPTSPIRISGRQTPSSTSVVRTLPTATPRGSVSSQATVQAGTPRTIRPQNSRDFVAGRRGSTATMQRRYSRADGGASSPGRRSSAPSLHSRRASTRSVSGRKSSADGSSDVPPVPSRRFEPRAPVKPLNTLERSPTSDLAEFLATTGPDLDSPELDRVLASSRERRRSSIAEQVAQTEQDAQLFPAAKRFARSTASSHAAGLAAFGAKDDRTFVEHLDVGDTNSSEAITDAPPPLPPKPQARRASTPLLTPGQKSPSMNLAEWISQTGPASDQRLATTRRPPPDLSNGFRDPFSEANAPSHSPQVPSASSSPTSQATSRFAPRSPVVSSELDEGASASPRGTELSLAEIIRDGPPPSPSLANTSPGSRAGKRWSIGGVGAKLMNKPAPNDGGSPKLASRRNDRFSADSPRSSNGWELVSEPEQAVDEQAQPLASQPLPFPTSPAAQNDPSPAIRRTANDQKRRPLSSFNQGEPLIVPASAQVPPPLDAHPANSPVEYVKLARTRGARLLRAVETKKRTYLAVLCGEEGERIELFTGSRSISLSLNRTFVLPETPKTIEFQLQGDDLVDIYLVYGESIFALEPATVRVREVGVGRSERRARRERERRMRDLATSTRVDAATDQPDELASSGLHAALHPADHVLRETEEASARAGAGRSRSPSPVPQAESAAAAEHDEPLPPQYTVREADHTMAQLEPAPFPTTNESPDPEAAAAPNKLAEPYTSFQQLPFVPPVPSSVLSSAYTIPPLYTDVVGPAAPSPNFPLQQPSITVTQESGTDEANVSPPPPPNEYDLPLLSPISLLGGQRQTGPPGLFFVSKGANLTGIVTADGKSVIKRPLVWGNDRAAIDTVVDGMQRIEVLVLHGKRTAVVRVSPQDVKVISVDGASPSQPFTSAIPVSPARSRPRIQFLATHAAGQQLVYSQTVGSAFSIVCLGPSALSS